MDGKDDTVLPDVDVVAAHRLPPHVGTCRALACPARQARRRRSLATVVETAQRRQRAGFQTGVFRRRIEYDYWELQRGYDRLGGLE